MYTICFSLKKNTGRIPRSTKGQDHSAWQPLLVCHKPAGDDSDVTHQSGGSFGCLKPISASKGSLLSKTKALFLLHELITDDSPRVDPTVRKKSPTSGTFRHTSTSRKTNVCQHSKHHCQIYATVVNPWLSGNLTRFKINTVFKHVKTRLAHISSSRSIPAWVKNATMWSWSLSKISHGNQYENNNQPTWNNPSWSPHPTGGPKCQPGWI